MSNEMITLIAYKSDSSDYCMGCHMASYSSDFKAHLAISEEEAVSCLRDIIATKLDINECSFEYALIIDGFKFGTLTFETDPTWYDEDDLPDSEYEARRLRREAASKLADSIIEQSKLKADEAIRERKRAEEAERLRREKIVNDYRNLTK